MINDSLMALVKKGRFEVLPDPLYFKDCKPLADMVNIDHLAARMSVHDIAEYKQKNRALAIKMGTWPEDEAAILWFLLALEMQDYDADKRPARYLNVLTDQLREALFEIPHADRGAFLNYMCF